MAYGKQHPGPRTPTVRKASTKVARHASDNNGANLLDAWLTAIYGPNHSTHNGNGLYKTVTVKGGK